MSVVALIPAHDEVERIGATVAATRSVGLIDRVLVIDDGSRDSTADAAEAAGAEVCRLERNCGKGAALQAGLDRVRADADVVVLLDADLGTTAAQAAALVGPVMSGDADMTVAVLPRPEGSGGFGLVKRLARWGIRRLAGYESQAPLSGQRALSRQAWEVATPFLPGFGVEVGLTVRIARAGMRVVEVPTTMTHAFTGRDLAGFLHRGRQFVAVAWALARLAAEPQSRRG